MPKCIAPYGLLADVERVGAMPKRIAPYGLLIALSELGQPPLFSEGPHALHEQRAPPVAKPRLNRTGFGAAGPDGLATEAPLVRATGARGQSPWPCLDTPRQNAAMTSPRGSSAGVKLPLNSVPSASATLS